MAEVFVNRFVNANFSKGRYFPVGHTPILGKSLKIVQKGNPYPVGTVRQWQTGEYKKFGAGDWRKV